MVKKKGGGVCSRNTISSRLQLMHLFRRNGIHSNVTKITG